MSKFFEILLKIVLVVSFICIIVFVCVAVINNQSIAYEAYNYIVSTRDKTNFSQTQKAIVESDDAVRVYYGGAYDPYARYINTAVVELNSGINFFVDYLSQEDKLTKGEQDKLIKGYREYTNKFNDVTDTYLSYKASYKEAHEKYTNHYWESDYAVETVNARSVILVKNYIDCYKLGSEFFKNLVEITNKYAIPNLSYQTYKAQSYMIKVGFIDYSLDDMNKRLDEKLRNPKYDNYTFNYNPKAQAFQKYNSTYNTYNDKIYLTDADFRNFTLNLNELNVYEWAGNYASYNATLNASEQEKSGSAHTFFATRYGVSN